jgi:hypothetical protein
VAAEKHREGCWLRVTVPLAEKDPDINRKVRDLLPNALVVRPELPDVGEPITIRLGEASPADYYTAFHLREYQRNPEPEVLETFHQLYSTALEGEG